MASKGGYRERRVPAGYHPLGVYQAGDRVRMAGEPATDWGVIERIYHSPYGRGRLVAAIAWRDGLRRCYVDRECCPLGRLRLIKGSP